MPLFPLARQASVLQIWSAGCLARRRAAEERGGSGAEAEERELAVAGEAAEEAMDMACRLAEVRPLAIG